MILQLLCSHVIQCNVITKNFMLIQKGLAQIGVIMPQRIIYDNEIKHLVLCLWGRHIGWKNINSGSKVINAIMLILPETHWVFFSTVVSNAIQIHVAILGFNLRNFINMLDTLRKMMSLDWSPLLSHLSKLYFTPSVIFIDFMPSCKQHSTILWYE